MDSQKMGNDDDNAVSAAFIKKFQLPERLRGSTESVWNEYTALSIKYQPLSLAHGYPDFLGPKYITEALVSAAGNPDYMLNQYTRGFGHPRLVQALSALYSKLIVRKIDPFNEILVTSGAYEALYTAIQGHIGEGDEVIIIEPFFDAYEPMVRMSGGTPRFIPLRLKKSKSNSDTISSGDYVLDDAELESMFNEKTKMIIINTPNNPMGKVYSRDELMKIANLCKKYNAICLSDEVTEWLVYNDTEFVRIASLPGMFERSITVGSGGKTFSVTGWKIGWAYGPANLIVNMQMVHQNCVYTCPTPIQEAFAIVFEKELERLNTPDSYFPRIATELTKKRDFMISFLKLAGMKPVVPQGGYFLIADWSALENRADMSSETDAQKDYRFTKWMAKNVGVLGIPPSAFFNDSHKKLMETFVRYCFVKQEKNLEKAADIFKNWIKTPNGSKSIA